MLGLVLVGLLILAPAAGAQGERASGALIDGAGNTVSSVELEQTTSGVRVTVQVPAAIASSTRGIHFHAVGRCDSPDFMTAGAHFNPTTRQHGLDNPEGPHAGDLPNLSANVYIVTTNRITLTAGPTSLFDADGTALVIHANADDNVSDPAGNSGGRIACAVLARAAPAALPSTGAGGMAPAALWWQAAAFGALTLGATAAAAGLLRRRA
jgi:Cu-Zn family superoxide dismutase